MSDETQNAFMHELSEGLAAQAREEADEEEIREIEEFFGEMSDDTGIHKLAEAKLHARRLAQMLRAAYAEIHSLAEVIACCEAWINDRLYEIHAHEVIAFGTLSEKVRWLVSSEKDKESNLAVLYRSAEVQVASTLKANETLLMRATELEDQLNAESYAKRNLAQQLVEHQEALALMRGNNRELSEALTDIKRRVGTAVKDAKQKEYWEREAGYWKAKYDALLRGEKQHRAPGGRKGKRQKLHDIKVAARRAAKEVESSGPAELTEEIVWEQVYERDR